MSEEVIDVHIHFGAPEDGESGCYWSKDFEKGVAFLAMRLVTNNLFGKMSLQRVKKHLFGVINGSEFVDKCVLLALDQVYEETGALNRGKTHLHVPNAYLVSLAETHERILFGASVHPYRPDWEEQLGYCLENGAVLNKWIPSSQQIDPQHPSCLPFYTKLAEAGLPLLCHVGPEAAIPPFNGEEQELNSPLRLRPALDAGVRVIMAHAALPLLPPPFESDQPFREMVALFQEAGSNDWKLYADLSAINLGPRSMYIDKLKDAVPPANLLFGSDYPIPVLDISQKPGLSLWDWLQHFFQTIFIKNPLDKNYRLIKNMDFDEAIFTNAVQVLRLG